MLSCRCRCRLETQLLRTIFNLCIKNKASQAHQNHVNRIQVNKSKPENEQASERRRKKNCRQRYDAPVGSRASADEHLEHDIPTSMQRQKEEEEVCRTKFIHSVAYDVASGSTIAAATTTSATTRREINKHTSAERDPFFVRLYEWLLVAATTTAALFSFQYTCRDDNHGP